MPIVGGGGNCNDSLGNLFNDKWELDGNNIVDGDYIGTNNEMPFIIKTNGTEKARIDVNGRVGIGTTNPQSHIHIKSHSGYEGSGLRLDTFVMESDCLDYNTVFSFIVPLNTVCLVTINVVGRQGTNERCAFRRTLLVFREGGTAQIVGRWQSDFTMKSNKEFDISYNITMDSVHFNVKNANPTKTVWSGHIEVDVTV